MRLPWRGRRDSVDAAIDQAIANVTWRKPPARAATPSSPPPGPALTPWERGVLATLATTPMPAQGARNGRELADAARQILDGLDDVQIGRAVLQAYWWAATFHRAMPPGVAMTATLDALGAAALDLTTLDRTEIPR